MDEDLKRTLQIAVGVFVGIWLFTISAYYVARYEARQQVRSVLGPTKQECQDSGNTKTGCDIYVPGE